MQEYISTEWTLTEIYFSMRSVLKTILCGNIHETDLCRAYIGGIPSWSFSPQTKEINYYFCKKCSPSRNSEFAQVLKICSEIERKRAVLKKGQSFFYGTFLKLLCNINVTMFYIIFVYNRTVIIVVFMICNRNVRLLQYLGNVVNVAVEIRLDVVEI